MQIWPYLLEGIDVKFSKAVAEEIEKQIGLKVGRRKTVT